MQQDVNCGFRQEAGSLTPTLQVGCSALVAALQFSAPGSLLLLSNSSTAPLCERSKGTERMISPNCIPTHASSTMLPGLTGCQGRVHLPIQAPCNSRGASGCLALSGPRQTPQELGALVPWDVSVPKSGILSVSTGLGHTAVWQHVFLHCALTHKLYEFAWRSSLADLTMGTHFGLGKGSDLLHQSIILTRSANGVYIMSSFQLMKDNIAVYDFVLKPSQQQPNTCDSQMEL